MTDKKKTCMNAEVGTFVNGLICFIFHKIKCTTACSGFYFKKLKLSEPPGHSLDI